LAISTRKIVYILGAGFSYGTDHSVDWGQSNIKMPLQNNLLELIFKLNYRKIRGLDPLAKTIRKYFSPDTYRSQHREGARRHQDLQNLSVEEIVTFFEEMVRDLESEIEAAVFRKAETELRKQTIDLIAYLSIHGSPGKNKILKEFRELLLGTDTVITFNWDTLLERALLNKGRWHPAWGYGASVRKAFTYVGDTPKALKKHVTILKLHGSINWLANNEERVITKNFSPNGRPDDVVMMPPKMLKREIWGEKPTEEQTRPLRGNWAIHDQKLYPNIWREAEEHLLRAKRIVFIGYSFPAADTSVFGLLRRSLATSKIKHGEHPEIFIVDPNAPSLAQRFYQSFKIQVPSKNQFLSLATYVLPRSRL